MNSVSEIALFILCLNFQAIFEFTQKKKALVKMRIAGRFFLNGQDIIQLRRYIGSRNECMNWRIICTDF